MKNSLKNRFTLLLIVICIVGCRKDPHIVDNPPIVDPCVEGTCVELTPPGPPGGGEVIDDQYLTQGVQYMTPCFNPNNADEFIYIRRGNSINPELVKYNLVTNEEVILLDPMSLGRPQWGRQGWIVFLYNNKKIWRLKDDGTQLSQITFGEDDRSPSFNYPGDEVFYYRNRNYSNAQLSGNPSLYNEYKVMVVDLDGNTIDSVVAQNVLPGNYYQKWDFASTDADGLTYFVGGSGPSAGFYILNNELDSVFPNMIQSLYPNTGWVRDLTYSSGFIYYTKYENGIYKTNVTTGVETKIRVGCNSNYYDYISVSPDGSKLLMEKITRKRIDYYSVDEQHDIWLFDLNTCEAQAILVGE